MDLTKYICTITLLMTVMTSQDVGMYSGYYGIELKPYIMETGLARISPNKKIVFLVTFIVL